MLSKMSTGGLLNGRTYRMDEIAALQAFEDARRTQRPQFETFFLSRFFGLTFTYAEDTLTIHFPVLDFMFNPQGSLHGGVAAFVLDVAMGHLLKHAVGVPGSTLEMKTQYLAAVRGGRARAHACFLRKGRNICFLEARLFDESGALAATATSTWRVNRVAQEAQEQTHHQGTGVQA
jgi:uncharacterized protein (TIGR00369 family)